MAPKRVGIDLAPAALTQTAPGTARLVREQARALFRLPVDWEWVPLVESVENPLWGELEDRQPIIVPGRRVSLRATFKVGEAWRKTGCQLGFSTAYFVPLGRFPVVANFFDSNIFEHGSTWLTSGRWKSYMLLQCLSRYALRRAKRLFVLSGYCRDFLARKFPHCVSRLVTVPCGLTHLPPAPPNHLPEWARNLEGKFCLYVGAFSDNKNQAALLEAWAELQAEHDDLPALVLLGPCDAAYRQRRIAPRLSALLRPQAAILPGLVSDADLSWAFQNAAFYVQPSIAEGFGMPVLEAMGHDLPVACSDSTSLPEVGGDATVYFNPHDIQSIKASIRALWRDDPLREECRRKGRARCALFTWEQNARSVANEIDALLKAS